MGQRMRRGCSISSSKPGPAIGRPGPGRATSRAFGEWFGIDIHNIVVDMGDDEIEGEEI